MIWTWLTKQTILNNWREKDNYQVYLLPWHSVFLSPPNRTSHCVHSLGASFDSSVDLDVCTSWYGVTHVLHLPNSLKCGIGSILVSVFVLVDPGPSLSRVRELKNPPCFSKCVLLIEPRQRSSAWVLLVENTNRTKSIFILLYP